MKSTKSRKRTSDANAGEISAAIERARHIDPLVQDFVNTREDKSSPNSSLPIWRAYRAAPSFSSKPGGDCTLATLRRIATALGLEMQAYTPCLPTLDDLNRENDMLFANRNVRGNN